MSVIDFRDRPSALVADPPPLPPRPRPPRPRPTVTRVKSSEFSETCGKPAAGQKCVTDPELGGCLDPKEGVFAVHTDKGTTCYNGKTMQLASRTVPMTDPLEGVFLKKGQLSEFATFEDESVPLRKITKEEALAYPHCKLKRHQLAANVVVPALTLGVFAVPAHLGGPVGAALAMIAPIPIWTLQPFVSKVAYTMGFLHARQTDAEESASYERENRGIVPNISPFGRTPYEAEDGSVAFKVNPGTYVWGLLSYGSLNRIRITVFGESFPTPKAFHASGGSLITYIEEAVDTVSGIAKANSEKLGQKLVNVTVRAAMTHYTDPAPKGKVTLVICHTPIGGKPDVVKRIQVGPLDGIQFVSCGSRPYFSKYHIDVDRKGEVRCTLKRANKTWLIGVARSEDAFLENRAAGFGVQTDGVSVPRESDLPPDHNALSVHKEWTKWAQERLS